MHIHFFKNRKEQIKNGRFLVTAGIDNPEYKRLLNQIPETSFGSQIKAQLKEAFMFNDPLMIREINLFIQNNIQGELPFEDVG